MTLQKRSTLFVLTTTLLLLISIYAFYNTICQLIPLVIILVINAYLLSLLFIAAIISDSPDPVKHLGKLNFYPNRVASLIIMILFFGVLTFSFAALYNHANWKTYPYAFVNSFDCVYASFSCLTTLGVDSINPDTSYLKKIVMLEIFSSLNLLIGSISFLLSRLTNF